MQPLFSPTAFTDKGVCTVLNLEPDVSTVRYVDGTITTVPSHGVRDFREEVARRAACIENQLFTEVAAYEAAELFPDTTDMDLPSGPRVPRKIPRQVRNLQKHGGYRPDQLPRTLACLILSQPEVVSRRISWAQHADEPIRRTITALGIFIPDGVVVQDTGKNVPDAEQAGGIGAYVTIPAPDDLSIIPLEFFKSAEYRAKAVHKNREGKRVITIGNARLLIGMELWPGVKFPSIKWLFPPKVNKQATPLIFAEVQ